MEEQRKTRTGRVVSDKMTQTVVVSVQSTKKHRLYKKLMRRDTHMMVHDPKGLARTGDLVKIVECRPISKLKHWMLAEILESKEQGAPLSEVAGGEA